jgi:hypothetical protein
MLLTVLLFSYYCRNWGGGPKDIRTHLINKVLLIRLERVLTAAEQQGAEVFRVKGCLEAFCTCESNYTLLRKCENVSTLAHGKPSFAGAIKNAANPSY